MDVAGSGPQVQGQRVVIDGHAPLVATDERHRRPALALPVQEQEVGHDHPEGVQVPVQGAGEHPCLQHHMAQPLDTGRLTGRTLGGVRATVIGTEVEDQRLLLGQRRQLLGAVHDPDRQARGIEQGDRLPTARYADVPDGTAGGAGQPVQVGPLGRAEQPAR